MIDMLVLSPRKYVRQKNNPFLSAQNTLLEGKKCATITVSSYINSKIFCMSEMKMAPFDH